MLRYAIFSWLLTCLFSYPALAEDQFLGQVVITQSPIFSSPPGLETKILDMAHKGWNAQCSQYYF